MNDKPLSGQVAIITGAGRGIGRALALGYAQAGAAVACVARSAAEIERVAAEIAADGGQAVAIVADVVELAAVERMVGQVVGIFGRIDLLVINAGISMPRTPLADSDPDQWKQVINVNLIGAYHCARTVVPHLKAAGGGKIITIGSGLGHRGTANGSAYAASKAALWSMTRILAQELYEHNISVNELVPGPVYTRHDTTHRGQIARCKRMVQRPRRCRSARPLPRHSTKRRPHRPKLQPHAPRWLRSLQFIAPLAETKYNHNIIQIGAGCCLTMIASPRKDWSSCVTIQQFNK